MSTDAENEPDADAYAQALSLSQKGRVEEALKILREIAPRMPKAMGDIAYAYYVRGDNDSALVYLRQYVEAFPDDAGGWALMAWIARDHGDLKQAERHARRAVALQPRNARYWFDLGEILSLVRDWKGAARAYRKCLTVDPQFSKARVRWVHTRRLASRDRIRAITWRPPIRWLLRRLLSWGLVSELIEIDTGIALNDPRWRMPLEWGAAADFGVSCPAGQEPDQFVAHFERCRCPFWQWFRSLRLDGPIRKVLEVGVGPGHIAHHFAHWGLKPQVSGFRFLSLTPSEFARRDRERREIRAVRGDFHFVCKRGASFDLIVADYALHHSRAPLFALWEWKRLLRPDGYLMVMAHLPLDRPALLEPNKQEARSKKPEASSLSSLSPPTSSLVASHVSHFAFGVPPHVMTLTYWQLRWLFKWAGFQLIAETLEDPERGCLEGVEHVDGRRSPDPTKPWNSFFLLRKPGRLPYDGALEKPRVPAPHEKPAPERSRSP